jgi:hypothetical protein
MAKDWPPEQKEAKGGDHLQQLGYARGGGETHTSALMLAADFLLILNWGGREVGGLLHHSSPQSVSAWEQLPGEGEPQGNKQNLVPLKTQTHEGGTSEWSKKQGGELWKPSLFRSKVHPRCTPQGRHQHPEVQADGQLGCYLSRYL